MKNRSEGWFGMARLPWIARRRLSISMRRETAAAPSWEKSPPAGRRLVRHVDGDEDAAIGALGQGRAM